MRATDDEGNTGMPFAARNGHVAAMALLRDAGVRFLCFVFLFTSCCFSVIVFVSVFIIITGNFFHQRSRCEEGLACFCLFWGPEARFVRFYLFFSLSASTPRL